MRVRTHFHSGHVCEHFNGAVNQREQGSLSIELGQTLAPGLSLALDLSPLRDFLSVVQCIAAPCCGLRSPVAATDHNLIGLM